MTFETEPFKTPFEIAGPVELVLLAESSAIDTDFTAKLLDIYPHSDLNPGGYELNLADSIIRARYRNGFESEDFLEPDTVYEFRIVLYPTANRFAKGHRMRVDISSSNYPRFDANPNTGDRLGVARQVHIAQQAIHHDSEHQSRLVVRAKVIDAQ